MLPIPTIPPPPPSYTEISTPLLAEPGQTRKLANAHIRSNSCCALLAWSTEPVGCLSHPIRVQLTNCTVQTARPASVIQVCNARAEIEFRQCTIGSRDNELLRVQKGAWGKPGYNAGFVSLKATDTHLRGNIYVDTHCQVELTLCSGSSWDGHFTGNGKGTLHQHPHSVRISQPIFTP